MSGSLPGATMLWGWDATWRPSPPPAWCMRMGSGESRVRGVKESALKAWQAMVLLLDVSQVATLFVVPPDGWMNRFAASRMSSPAAAVLSLSLSVLFASTWPWLFLSRALTPNVLSFTRLPQEENWFSEFLFVSMLQHDSNFLLNAIPSCQLAITDARHQPRRCLLQVFISLPPAARWLGPLLTYEGPSLPSQPAHPTNPMSALLPPLLLIPLPNPGLGSWAAEKPDPPLAPSFPLIARPRWGNNKEMRQKA